MQGASPLAFPGLNPGGTGLNLPCWCPAGACQVRGGGRRSGAPALEPGAALGKRAVAASAGGLTFSVAGFACRSSNCLPLSPLPPFPSGEGGVFSFLMQGASPLAFPGLNPGGTGLNLPCWCPAGACQVRGGGRRSGAPALEPGAALGKRAVAASAGGLTFSVAGFACRSSAFLPPSPLPPSPSGKGEIFSFFMQGASPLASPGAGRGAALARLALAVPRGGRALLVAGSPCHYGTRRGQIRQAPEKMQAHKNSARRAY